MKLIDIKKNELENFLLSDIYKNSKNIPITKYRAISQINNPRANNEDVILIIAVDDLNQIIGFIGALPDRLADYPSIKLAWNSCWWVDKASQSNTSMKLLFRFFSVWNSNVMMRDLTEHTKKIILSIKGFSAIRKLHGRKYFLRLNLIDKVKSFKIFFRLSDSIFNFITNIYMKLFVYKNIESKDFYFEFSNSLSKEDSEFISKLNTTEIFKRNVTELNWILKYPWLVQRNEKDTFEERYFFSSVKKTFSNKIIYVKEVKSKKLIAIIFIKEINKNVEIPYIYFEPENLPIVSQIILNYLIKEKAISFLTFNDNINNWLSKNRKSYIFMKRIEKEFVINEKLKPYINDNFKFQDGEGDYVFA